MDSLAFNLLNLFLGCWKNPHPNNSEETISCDEGCSELHQQQGGAALWIYRRVQGLLGWMTGPWCWWLSSWLGGKGQMKIECKELWNDEICGSGVVSHYSWSWIFLGFLNFEDGKMVEQLIPRNSETASFATRWRANLVFGVVVGRDLTMSTWSEPLNGPMPRGQHFNLWILSHFQNLDGSIPFSEYSWVIIKCLHYLVLPGNAMMVLTPFVSLMTTPYMVLVGLLSSRIGGWGIVPWNPRKWRRKGQSPNCWKLRSCLPHQVQSLGWI